jgi:hypothetical protein
MTGKIKLNAGSGGGSVSFQAPSSTGDDRIITLPTTADGTVLTTTNPKAGNIIQVKQAVKTDFFTTTSQTYVDLTGLSTTMTLTSSGNKILMSYNVTTGGNWWNLGPVYLVFVQDSTKIGVGTGGTDADHNPTTFANLYSDGQSNSSYNICQQSASFLFAPSDTNSHTYKIQIRGNNTTGASVNRWWASANVGAISTLTLMEVAA